MLLSIKKIIDLPIYYHCISNPGMGDYIERTERDMSLQLAQKMFEALDAQNIKEFKMRYDTRKELHTGERVFGILPGYHIEKRLVIATLDGKDIEIPASLAQQ